jgi:catechol 2,3-dioxygenase-like lactoylglutathione lyase family enzyme
VFESVWHVAYLTDDLAAATRVFVDLFGGTVEREAHVGGGRLKVAFVRVGGAAVELVEPADRTRLNGRTGLVLDHVGFTVADLDATIEQLSAKGATFASEQPSVNPEGARLIYPSAETVLGARIHLTEPPRV